VGEEWDRYNVLAQYGREVEWRGNEGDGDMHKEVHNHDHNGLHKVHTESARIRWGSVKTSLLPLFMQTTVRREDE
jgi:hypothetical protein